MVKIWAKKRADADIQDDDLNLWFLAILSGQWVRHGDGIRVSSRKNHLICSHKDVPDDQRIGSLSKMRWCRNDDSLPMTRGGRKNDVRRPAHGIRVKPRIRQNKRFSTGRNQQRRMAVEKPDRHQPKACWSKLRQPDLRILRSPETQNQFWYNSPDILAHSQDRQRRDKEIRETPARSLIRQTASLPFTPVQTVMLEKI